MIRPVTESEIAYLTPEARARVEIDRQLAAAGWAVQTFVGGYRDGRLNVAEYGPSS